MNENERKILSLFSVRKLILPIIIGFGVLFYVFFSSFDAKAFQAIQWSWASLFWLCMAILMMFVRQAAYMYRIRFLTGQKLSWRHAFQVIMLWEFSSAATPTSVGGTAVALFLLAKEKMNAGKAAAIVMATIFLDMTFLLSLILCFFIIMPLGTLFPPAPADQFQFLVKMEGWIYYFGITFTLVAAYTLLVIYGLFLNPRGFKWIMVKTMSIGFLRKWRHSAAETGDQLIIASADLRSQNRNFWLHTFASTAITWSARFLVLNCLIMAITPFHDHLILYARQMILMIMLMMTPTPGGAGVAEISINAFIADVVPSGLEGIVIPIWRLFTYWPYLFFGLAVLPVWVRRVFEKKADPEIG